MVISAACSGGAIFALNSPTCSRSAVIVSRSGLHWTAPFRDAGCAELHLAGVTRALLDQSDGVVKHQAEREVDVTMIMREGTPPISFRAVLRTDVGVGSRPHLGALLGL